MNCDTYIKNIEALPNFGGWVIYDLEGTILEEFDIYDEMIEVYDYSYSNNPDTVAGYAMLDPRQVGNTTLKAAEIYRQEVLKWIVKEELFSIVFLEKIFGTLEKINIIFTTQMVARSILIITFGIGIIGWGIGLNTQIAVKE